MKKNQICSTFEIQKREKNIIILAEKNQKNQIAQLNSYNKQQMNFDSQTSCSSSSEQNLYIPLNLNNNMNLLGENQQINQIFLMYQDLSRKYEQMEKNFKELSGKYEEIKQEMSQLKRKLGSDHAEQKSDLRSLRSFFNDEKRKMNYFQDQQMDIIFNQQNQNENEQKMERRNQKQKEDPKPKKTKKTKKIKKQIKDQEEKKLDDYVVHDPNLKEVSFSIQIRKSRFNSKLYKLL